MYSATVTAIATQDVKALQYIFGLFAFALFWGCLAFAVRTIRLRKPGTPLFPSPLESPFNYLFSSAHLTEAGRRARFVCFVLGVACIVCIGVIVLMAR